ncbi:phage tail protein [Spirulina subsalsa FACHB-351]|uniref:Phage tail protein n=1 Tax=Spirulina subsalsa FACHB-351 TaxID=234711 RepID=A0ABT3L5R3_9CYAN|nr:phage tail protein [Spirulina subsalsa]MCW6036833.1 phage tail protein [Spirulina subsalsa FACHB-351]
MRQQLALGEDFVFSLGREFPYSSLQRKSDGGWIEIDIVYAKPASQNTGQGLDEIRLSGTAFYAIGMQRLDELRAMQAERRPYVLVDGLGQNLGRWKIMAVEENQSRIIDDGTAMRVAWTVQLQEFVDHAASGEDDSG